MPHENISKSVKSYADKRRKPIKYTIEEQVFLKVSPMRGIMRFGKKGKLSPKYVRLFETIERIGPVDYRLALPVSMTGVFMFSFYASISEILLMYFDTR